MKLEIEIEPETSQIYSKILINLSLKIQIHLPILKI